MNENDPKIIYFLFLIHLDATTKAIVAKIHDDSLKATNNNNKLAVKKSVTSIAKHRWKILSKALCHHHNSFDEFDRLEIGQQTPQSDSQQSMVHSAINQTNRSVSDDYLASVRRFTCFNLFQRTPTMILHFDTHDNNNDASIEIQSSENWFTYRTTIDDRDFSLVIHEICQKFTPEELIGFNNTGNICIWPSEEVLAFYVLHHLSAFNQRRVLELGGGMSCLAGLFIAKYTQAKFVHLTDGNELSIQNANEMLAQNLPAQAMANVFCSVLKWENINHAILEDAQYDCIMSADCLFFDSVRPALVNALWQFMKPTGFALIMAPCRGDTLNHFIQQAKQRGFNCCLRKCYNQIIWQKHLDLLKADVYDEDIHYPILIEITKPTKSHRVPIIPLI